MPKFSKRNNKTNDIEKQETGVEGNKKPIYKRWWVWLVGFFLLVGVAGGGDESEGNDDSTEAETEEVEEEVELVEEPEEEVEEEPEEEEIEEEIIEEEIEEVDEIVEEEPEEDLEELFAFDPEDYRTDLTYNDLARTDDYIFEDVKFTGTVVQVMQGTGYNQMRVAIDDDFERIILVEYNPDDLEYRLMDDDWIDIYGYSFGMVSYETVLGAEMSIPAIVADQVELRE